MVYYDNDEPPLMPYQHNIDSNQHFVEHRLDLLTLPDNSKPVLPIIFFVPSIDDILSYIFVPVVRVEETP